MAAGRPAQSVTAALNPAAVLEFLVAGGDPRSPDAGKFLPQLGGVGDGPFGQGLQGLGQEAVEVAGVEGGQHQLAGG